MFLGDAVYAETDLDGDGFLACNDCDDSDGAQYPGADEYCNGEDDDCDGDIDEDDIKMEFVNLIVVIDPHSAHMLEGTEIDYIQTLQKKGFVFNNPNASRTCGCGSSFS